MEALEFQSHISGNEKKNASVQFQKHKLMHFRKYLNVHFPNYNVLDVRSVTSVKKNVFFTLVPAEKIEADCACT